MKELVIYVFQTGGRGATQSFVYMNLASRNYCNLDTGP